MKQGKEINNKGFCEGFVWGAASASYQVEGAAALDGKGPSVWDALCKRPGAIWNGHTGEVACDHVRRYREDVSLMRQIGLNAYRFSISWPRVLPAGVGKVNRKGLDFYDRLVDELLHNEIEPYITLFHWDYPEELFRRGGWLNPDSPDWFAEYTRAVVKGLSDRVKCWMTQNEPQCYIGLGHLTGVHAPGLKLPMRDILLMTHHSLLAHGKSVKAIRAASRKKAFVGLAPVGVVCMPASDSARDVAAARRATMSVSERHGVWNNTWWLDPILKGRYPADGLRLYGADAPKFTREELKTMCQPVDFLGLNIYQGAFVRAGEGKAAEEVPLPAGHGQTANKWFLTPPALYWGPKFLHERYKLPIFITENGLSSMDWVALDGRVHDPNRIDYTARYLRELRRASRDGVPVRGYFHWSVMDNFEWAEGYKERFGLIYVDYSTQRRILKDSAYWYSGVIANNGANI